MSILDLLLGHSRAAKAEREKRISTTLREDAELVLTGDLQQEQSFAMYERHEAIGISAERFAEIVEALSRLRDHQAAIGDGDNYAGDIASLQAELSDAQNERDRIKQRLEKLESTIPGLAGNIQSLVAHRQFHRDSISDLQRDYPELFSEVQP